MVVDLNFGKGGILELWVYPAPEQVPDAGSALFESKRIHEIGSRPACGQENSRKSYSDAQE